MHNLLIYWQLWLPLGIESISLQVNCIENGRKIVEMFKNLLLGLFKLNAKLYLLLFRSFESESDEKVIVVGTVWIDGIEYICATFNHI